MKVFGTVSFAILIAVSGVANSQGISRAWEIEKQMHSRPGSDAPSKELTAGFNLETKLQGVKSERAQWTMFTPASKPGAKDWAIWQAGCLTESDAIYFLQGLKPQIRSVVGDRESYLMEGMLDGRCFPAVSADGRYAWQSCIANDLVRSSSDLMATAAKAVRLCESRTKQVCYPTDLTGDVFRHKDQFTDRPASYWKQMEDEYSGYLSRGYTSPTQLAQMKFWNESFSSMPMTPVHSLKNQCVFGELSGAAGTLRVLKR
jgi:hypothetical protein